MSILLRHGVLLLLFFLGFFTLSYADISSTDKERAITSIGDDTSDSTVIQKRNCQNCPLIKRTSPWSTWSSCSKTCDYGGSMTRYRTVIVSNSDSSSSSKSCFKRCCHGQFHCSTTNNKKCIAARKKCDYVDDCGDKEDEAGEMCNMLQKQKCRHKFTSEEPTGKGNMKYVDSLGVWCGAYTPMQEFYRTGVDKRLHYFMSCCDTNHSIPALKSWYMTQWTKYENVISLNSQKVKCVNDQFMTGYQMQRKKQAVSWGKYKYYVRYNYACIRPISKNLRDRMECKLYRRELGTIKVRHLMFHRSVNCAKEGPRWFLNGFHLEHKGNDKHVQHKYWCCRIKP